ncbi:VIT1/CCC1 transporter family protein [Kitasatospora sp. NPDC088346]|uniref:VIT1/CCC1 transporter family protein n=1 Tax=Kitasatospora sp. NPDC088346 TaxID=3364073 RepID=UPI0037FF4EAE
MTSPAGGPDWAVLAPRWDPAERSDAEDRAAEEELSAIGRTADRVAGGGIRAAVLGVNDGLVTNLCMVLGVAGASVDVGTVRLSGLASLVAGALSMAAGEWVSVRSQVEVARGMEDALQRAWRRSPPVVLAQLSGSMRARGLDPETAARASRGVVSAGRGARSTSLRILYGVSAQDAGTPVVAAVSSLLLFALGALVPLLPWFFTAGGTAVAASTALTALASLVVGGALGRGSGRSAAWTAVRQLLIVAVASAVTFGLGRLAGSAVL